MKDSAAAAQDNEWRFEYKNGITGKLLVELSEHSKENVQKTRHVRDSEMPPGATSRRVSSLSTRHSERPSRFQERSLTMSGAAEA
jgi:hypothetical protein